MNLLRIYVICLIATILITKLIAIIKKDYAYDWKYVLICLALFYIPILVYVIFS